MPGLQGQADWAFFEDHLVPEDGRMKKLYCFLMILGFSRMRYIEFVTDMSTSTLIRCHQSAFRYLGGYPQEIRQHEAGRGEAAAEARRQHAEQPV